jgi:hypothetical protein
MLSSRKPLAALAAITAAAAVTIPVASASAAAPTSPTVDPQVCQLLSFAIGSPGLAQSFGGPALAGVLTNAGGTVGCAAQAAPASALPAVPLWP